MALQSANNRQGRGRVIITAAAGGALAAGFMAGVGVTVANAEPSTPSGPNTQVEAPAIVPDGVTGEAAKRAKAAAAAAADPAAADPAATGTATDAPPQTADEVLAIIYRDYDTGAGGGQLSNLIHSVMQMRAQGFMASKADKDAIVSALDYRPNQAPLVKALKQTLATQQKQKSQKDTLQGNNGGGGGYTVGINQPNPDNPGAFGGFTLTPGG